MHRPEYKKKNILPNAELKTQVFIKKCLKNKNKNDNKNMTKKNVVF